MAQLDRFLEALSEYRAEALILESDRAPAFRFLSGTRSVSKQVLDTHRILGLIAELASPDVVVEYERSRSASFVYQMGPATFTGMLEEEAGRAVATIWEATQRVAQDENPPMPYDPMYSGGTSATHSDHSLRLSAAVAAVRSAAGAGTSRASALAASRPSAAMTARASTRAVPDATSAGAPADRTGSGTQQKSSRLLSLEDTGTDDLVPDDLPPNYRNQMDYLLRDMVHRGASDLHLCCGQHPYHRIDGVVTIDESQPILDAEELFRMLFSITPQRNREDFLKNRDTDFAYSIGGVSRYRANLFFDRFGPGAVFRAVPNEIMSARELGLSPQVMDLAMLNKGLVLVTGPTGSGKSTTLAALLDLVNQRRRDHIITIEDPVEFVHGNRHCLVNQREVGVHTLNFKTALRAALREDPDVILVGELRDLETVEMAIETAETGHLVFGTLHTTTATSTVDRIIDQFPSDRQAQIRVMLSESLRAVISQTLLRRRTGGRIAAHEILFVNHSVSNLIREGKTFQLESVLQTGKRAGMQTLNDDLLRLVREGVVDVEDALHKSIHRGALREMMERSGIAVPTSDTAPSPVL
jgi:twitching motility protein PilT